MKRNRVRAAVVPLALSAFTAFQAGPAAAVDVFLRLDDIKGESLSKGYVDQIDVLAWSWQLSRPVDRNQVTQPVIRPIKIEKDIDAATPQLYNALLKGTPIKSGDLVVANLENIKDEPVEIIKLSLTDVIVSGIASGATAGADAITESITLNFQEVCLTYAEDPGSKVCYETPIK